MSAVLEKTLTHTLNVRVPEDIFQQLEAIAQATERTKSYVMLAALSRYLKEQSWQIQEIEAGIAEAEAGEFATEEEVNQTFAKYGA